MEKFTASEVRRQASTFGRGRVNNMLRAFADLLEAQERAVPVAWMVSDDGWNQCFTTLDPCRMYWKEMIPLYTHPAPSDAEKRETMTPRELAKSIERGEKWKLVDESAPCQSQDAERLADRIMKIIHPHLDTGDSRTAADWAVEIYHAICTHFGEAQPPAASVTDAMEWRKRIEAAAYIIYLYDWCQDEECPVDFTEAFLRSLREKWINGWLPARFEEHCGDCTKVAAPCTRCGIERYFSDAARLLGAPKAAIEAALAAQENPNG